MISPEGQKFVQDSRAAGMTDMQIQQALTQSGWQLTDINEALGISPALTPTVAAVPPRKHKWLKRIGIVIACLVVVLGATYFIFPAVYLNFPFEYYVLYQQHNPSSLYVLPKTREIGVVDAGSGAVVSSMGLTFRVPWGAPSDRKSGTLSGETIEAIHFSSGAQVNVVKIPGGVKDRIVAFSSDTGNIDSVYSKASEGLNNSNFEIYKAILNVSPSELSYKMSAQNAEKLNSLLLLKDVLILSQANTALYEFQVNGMHGFQMGDPSLEEKKDALTYIFDSQNNWYQVSFRYTTQADIDYVLSTLQVAQ